MSSVRRRHNTKSIIEDKIVREVVTIYICKSSGGPEHCKNPDNCKHMRGYVYEQDPPVHRKKTYKYIYHS